MTIVVLKKVERLLECRTRNEHGANPVMNQSTRHIDRLSSLSDRDAFDVELAALQFAEFVLLLVAGQRVDSEKRFREHLRLGHPHVAVERRNGTRLQIGCGHG